MTQIFKRPQSFLVSFLNDRSLNNCFLNDRICLKTAIIPLQKLTAVTLLVMGLGVVLPAHACTIPKSYYKHVSCTANSRYFLAVKDSGAPVALLDKGGKKAVDLSRYTQVDASKLSSGLLPVQRLGKLGYVNMQGREVVPAVYDILTGDAQGWARAVSNGLIVVKKDGKYGVINSSNKVVVPFSSSYQNISDFNQGVAQVRKNGKTSWIDKQGRTTSNPNPAPVPKPDQSAPAPATSKQNTQAPTPPSSAPSQATNSAVNRGGRVWEPVKRDGKWGFINERGVPMITFSFDEVRPFSEGLAGVRVADNWGFVNLAGELVIPFRFDQQGVINEAENGSYKGKSSFVFTGGKAWIGNLKNGDKLCIDTDGTNVSCN